MAGGSERSFLEDGDEVVLGRAGGDVLSLGEVRGAEKAIHRLAPNRLRDDVRLRSIFVGAGLGTGANMHSSATQPSSAPRRRGAGAWCSTKLCPPSCSARSSTPGAELHLVDPLHHGWALPAGAAN